MGVQLRVQRPAGGVGERRADQPAGCDPRCPPPVTLMPPGGPRREPLQQPERLGHGLLMRRHHLADGGRVGQRHQGADALGRGERHVEPGPADIDPGAAVIAAPDRSDQHHPGVGAVEQLLQHPPVVVGQRAAQAQRLGAAADPPAREVPPVDVVAEVRAQRRGRRDVGRPGELLHQGVLAAAVLHVVAGGRTASQYRDADHPATRA